MHLRRWLMAAAVLLTAACRSDGRVAGDAPAKDPRLQGRWAWVHSTGGYTGSEVTPSRLGHRVALEFTDEDTYREYWNGVPRVQTRFQVQEGRTFNTGDTLVLLVLPDSSEFFRNFGEDALAIRYTSADTLILFGSSSEAWYHTLVRETAEESAVRR